jgi:hypothetical protein
VHDAGATLLELLDGMREAAQDDTPPLRRGAGGFARVRELLSGIGGRG